MGIEIIHGSPKTAWFPVKPGSTLYSGGLVAFDASAPADCGVIHLPQAAGVSNTTNKDVPLGVILGNNLKTKLYSATYQTDYITAVAAGSEHGATTEFFGVEGQWAKGEKLAMVEVALIDSTTILRAPIKNAAIGTAPTLLTATTASTDGLGITTNATQCTPVANRATFYCRKGANAGSYRVMQTTSTTVHTWTTAWNNDSAVGDTGIIVPFTLGPCFAQIGATAAMWLEANFAAATHYFILHVDQLNLQDAGKEYADFRFDADNFSAARA